MSDIVRPIFIQIGSPEWNEIIKTVAKAARELSHEDGVIWLTTSQAMKLAGITDKSVLSRFLKKHNVKVDRRSYRKLMIEKDSLIQTINNTNVGRTG